MIDKYQRLREVFEMAIEQASNGKGNERHNPADEPFEEQQICQIGRWQKSVDFNTGQAIKKCLEISNLPETHKKVHELLGALNFIAAAIILLTEKDKPMAAKIKGD